MDKPNTKSNCPRVQGIPLYTPEETKINREVLREVERAANCLVNCVNQHAGLCMDKNGFCEGIKTW